MFSHIGVPGVTGLLLKDLNANPLAFEQSAAMTARRQQMSAIEDSTDPDLGAFYRQGGKMIVTIGTNDTLASPGAQLDYYQAVIDKMGQDTVDRFARFFVIPQTGHGLTGTNYSVDGDGKTIPTAPIPNTYDRLGILMDWVENNIVPGKSLTITAGEKSLPLCSYPAYPKYVTGLTKSASSYTCSVQ
jgi:Tannase and feruloyl esterase